MPRGSPFPRPSLQGTHAALPSPILCRLSRPRGAAFHLAVSRSGGLPRRAGDVIIAAGQGWLPARGARSATMPFILPNTGLVVVGRTGDDLRMDYTAEREPISVYKVTGRRQ
jgi:hypothetical protein